MKKWIMTLLLGGLLLSGTWASGEQKRDPPATAALPSSNVPLPAAVQVQRQIGIDPLRITTARATMAGKAEKTSFLGVVTTQASATLRSQLKLKAGLVVDRVEPKSSAETAGLQVHDIIEKCDDQWLINPAQFVGLIRMYKPGETVKLTILHQGEQKKITAKLEERETYAIADDGDVFFYARQVDPNNPQGPVTVFTMPVAGYGGPVQQITAGALDNAPLVPGFVATFGDDKLNLLIEMRDGSQILTAKDSNDKQIFHGPIDTPEQRNLLPQDVCKQLEEMEKIKIKIRSPKPGGREPAPGNPSIVGKWKWIGDPVFRADNVFAQWGQEIGRWRCVDKTARKYEIKYTHPTFIGIRGSIGIPENAVDTMILSPDGMELDGVNPANYVWHGTKVRD
ncbi:MAG: PDZ domain-containing protein [Thermoguttaceae bacterium]